MNLVREPDMDHIAEDVSKLQAEHSLELQMGFLMHMMR